MSQNPQILDGKVTSEVLRNRLQKATAKLAQQGITARLDVILVGEDPASITYINNKLKACEKVGLESQLHQLPYHATKEEVIAQIEACNNDPAVNGIILQLPLPRALHRYEDEIMACISPNKDADCFLAENVGKIFLGTNTLIPCTAQAVVQLLDYYGHQVQGKHVVIVGTSNIVGKPLALELINRQATVTTCNIFTHDLSQYTTKADILISAAGVGHLIREHHVKEGTIVLDVGANFIDNPEYDAILGTKLGTLENLAPTPEHAKDARKQLTKALMENDPRFAGLELAAAKKLLTKITNPTIYCGDVDAQAVMHKVAAISLVPGGVGQNTVSNLLQNTVVLCLQQHNLELADYGLADVKGFE